MIGLRAWLDKAEMIKPKQTKCLIIFHVRLINNNNVFIMADNGARIQNSRMLIYTHAGEKLDQLFRGRVK